MRSGQVFIPSEDFHQMVTHIKVTEEKLLIAIKALTDIYFASQKGDGTSTECEITYIANDILQFLDQK